MSSESSDDWGYESSDNEETSPLSVSSRNLFTEFFILSPSEIENLNKRHKPWQGVPEQSTSEG